MSKIDELIQQLCPNGVEYRRLNEICNMRGRIGFRGYTRRDLVAPGQGAISLSPSNISNGVVSYSNCTYISWDKYDESPEIKVNIGDIIFTKTASVGKTALIKSLPAKATINPQLVLITATNCNSAYLSYVLQGKAFQDEVLRMTGIGSVPNISQANLGSIEIPLPPLPVQEEIVRILDAFTSHAAELQAELQARQEQYEYYRNKLLSFEDDSSVEWKKLGDVCAILDSRRRPVSKGKRVKGIYPYYGANGIQDYVDDYIFNGTYLLVGEDGSVINKDKSPVLNWATGRIWVNNHAHILSETDSGANLRYLYYALSVTDVSDVVRGTPPKLNQKNLQNLLIPIPPLPVQEEIVAILDKFEALVNDLTEGLPAEIAARQEQYEYYRDKLLSFPKAV